MNSFESVWKPEKNLRAASFFQELPTSRVCRIVAKSLRPAQRYKSASSILLSKTLIYLFCLKSPPAQTVINNNPCDLYIILCIFLSADYPLNKPLGGMGADAVSWGQYYAHINHILNNNPCTGSRIWLLNHSAFMRSADI